MEKLQQQQRQIRDAAWQCHSDPTDVDLDLSSEGSAFAKKSCKVQSELQSCIDAVSQRHALASRTSDDLSLWLETKNDNLRPLICQPMAMDKYEV